MRDVNSKDFN